MLEDVVDVISVEEMTSWSRSNILARKQAGRLSDPLIVRD